jgi:para-nitrobenzyl esterase
MKKSLLLAIFTLSLTWAQAQPENPYCDGTRYVSEVFQNVDVVSNIQYGANTTFCGTAKNLLMDIYTPQGDAATQRPVVFMGFGGSFISGARTDGYVQDLCNRYARRGFVAVAYDYRLFELCVLPPDSVTMLDVVVKAVGDLKAAVRYMREHATDYGVDTNYIFAGGVSAGGVLSCNAAYLGPDDNVAAYVLNAVNANGGWDGNTSNNYQYSSSIQGVVSMSGALHRSAWLDTDDGPLYAIHETGDGTVPYATGFANVFGINLVTLQGGASMHYRADDIGVPNSFVSITANAHTAYMNDANRVTQIVTGSSELFHDYVFCPTFASNPSVEAFEHLLNAYPNPSEGDLLLEIGKPANERWTLELRNELGQLVRSVAHRTETVFPIERGALPSGVYFLTVRFEDTPVVPMTKRVVFMD